MIKTGLNEGSEKGYEAEAKVRSIHIYLKTKNVEVQVFLNFLGICSIGYDK